MTMNTTTLKPKNTEKIQQFNSIEDLVIVEAIKNREFKQQLLNNPREAMKNLSINLPSDINVKVIEEDVNTLTITLPKSYDNYGLEIDERSFNATAVSSDANNQLRSAASNSLVYTCRCCE